MASLSLALAALLATSLSASAQTVPLAHEAHAYAYLTPTGLQAREAGVVASHDVHVDGALWLRLQLADVKLPQGVQLRITSLLDGARQHLDAKTLAQWQNTTAYFNGPAVRVELLAGRAGDAGRFGIVKVIAGKANEQPETQCGPTDDRTSSNAKDRARLLDIGCTANLMTKGCFITAGHCLATASLIDVVEFNVPKSNADTSLNHPAPKDQYVPNTSTRQFSNNGIGNDWGVFTVFANSETGLTPLQAQGSKLKLAKTVPVVGAEVEVTGYGVDAGVDNQTQQVSTGPISAVNTGATSLDYRSDTEGGNSGSAVLSGGRVVAIHTHGGCTQTGGANHGTLFTNRNFKKAFRAVCSTAQ
ncbi:MAG TPA: trypsin-like peptidase domain-containing protein [Ideonella sp.]|nr:trypsin-like peptidase domain-containing protein [Ideonella sp.]